MAKICFMLFCFLMTSTDLLRGTDEYERDAKIDQFVTHYGSRGQELEALMIIISLAEQFPGDAYFNILEAKTIWQELEDRLGHNVNYDDNIGDSFVNENIVLISKFHQAIEMGMKNTEEIKTPRDKYLRATMHIVGAGFKMRFESPNLLSLDIGDGIKARQYADREVALGLQLLEEAVNEDNSLCSSYYIFAVTKYKLIQKTNFFTKALIDNVFSSLTYKQIGSNFNPDDVENWFEKAMSCSSGYYYTKEIEWEKKLAFKQYLLENHHPEKRGHYQRDLKLLSMLEELCRKFPDNKRIQNEYFLISRHKKTSTK